MPLILGFLHKLLRHFLDLFLYHFIVVLLVTFLFLFLGDFKILLVRVVSLGELVLKSLVLIPSKAGVPGLSLFVLIKSFFAEVSLED